MNMTTMMVLMMNMVMIRQLWRKFEYFLDLGKIHLHARRHRKNVEKQSHDHLQIGVSMLMFIFLVFPHVPVAKITV